MLGHHVVLQSISQSETRMRIVTGRSSVVTGLSLVRAPAALLSPTPVAVWSSPSVTVLPAAAPAVLPAP